MYEKPDVSKNNPAAKKAIKEKAAKRNRNKTGTKKISKKNLPEKEETLCTVTFHITDIPTNFGDNVYILGSSETLGDWNIDSQSGKCEYLDYGTWELQKVFKKGESFEFKVVKKLLDGTVLWQDGDNLNYTVSSKDDHVNIKWTQN